MSAQWPCVWKARIARGFVVALLECLTGASYDEIIADYMKTFTNYYGLQPGEAKYDYSAQHGVVLSLERAFGVDDLTTVDLAAEAEKYLQSTGLLADEIAALKQKLTESRPAAEQPKGKYPLLAARAWLLYRSITSKLAQDFLYDA